VAWDDSALTMKRSCPTRWASKTEAVSAISDTLLADLTTAAEEGKSAPAIGLRSVTRVHDARLKICSVRRPHGGRAPCHQHPLIKPCR
jgi:hypothetical protein